MPLNQNKRISHRWSWDVSTIFEKIIRLCIPFDDGGATRPYSLFRCSRLPIQNDFSDQESDSRRIQVVDGAQPLLHCGLFRASQAFRDQLIEQINRVILGYGLEHACESN